MNDLQFIKSAENTLLASYLNDYTLLEASTFKEDFIYFKENKEIFKAMQSLLKKELQVDEDFIFEINLMLYMELDPAYSLLKKGTYPLRFRDEKVQVLLSLSPME